MRYTPRIATSIPADIHVSEHAGIETRFAAINQQLSKLDCATKARALEVAAVSLSQSGAGACGYPTCHKMAA